MITICSQPDNIYFHWQNLIQFYNLRNMGILKDHRAIFLVQPNQRPTDFILSFKESFPHNVFIYEDNRVKKHYIPTIKIHGVVKYLEEFGDDTDLMLIDSDIIFREPINYELFDKDNTVYCSDTKGYLGYQYLKTKGDDIITDMTNFCGITLQMVIDKNDQSGGAQLFYKGVSGLLGYFKEIDVKATEMYDLMRSHKTFNDYIPTIQAWTSEMWCVLWLLWSRNVETEIHKELDFVWATDNLSRWNDSKILHMAGVTSSHKDLFYKGKFINKSPFNGVFNHIREDSITLLYLDEMKEMIEDTDFKKLSELIK